MKNKLYTCEMSRCVNNVIFILNCVTVLKSGFYIFVLNSVPQENLVCPVFLPFYTPISIS